MLEYLDINSNFIISSQKHDICLFEEKELFNRYKELMLLHQSIHVQTICNTSPKWQKLYCNLLLELNKKSKTENFPTELLKLIPCYKECILEPSKGVTNAK